MTSDSLPVNDDSQQEKPVSDTELETGLPSQDSNDVNNAAGESSGNECPSTLDMLDTLISPEPDLNSDGWAETVDVGLQLAVDEEGEIPPGATIRESIEYVDDESAHERESVNVRVTRRSVSGDRFGSDDSADYELVKELGRGGMGVVFKARQASIDREVAVKMLKADGDDGDHHRARFLEEAAVTGELDHPNIIPVYDLGTTGEGLIFYSMKEVRGTRWRDNIAENTEDENLRILMQVADAIAFAHSRGVVHRDLKPENIMLGEFGEVLVMDWGLAILTDRASQLNTGLGGTPRYMAPEMASGPLSNVGPKSDIYLLGALLFEILNGVPPHGGKTVRQCLKAASVNKIVEYERKDELMAIALKAMATQPQERYQSVKEFQSAVREFQAHAESNVLAARALKKLDQALENKDYNDFTSAISGFQNALDLWDGNTFAAEQLLRTREAYAKVACEKSDFDLGLSLLAHVSGDFGELRSQLVRGQKERDARAVRLRRVRWTATSLGLGLIVVMSVAIVWILRAERATRSERDIAMTQMDRADRNFDRARDAVDRMLIDVGEGELEDAPHLKQFREQLLRRALSFYTAFLAEQPDDPALWLDTAKVNESVGDIAERLEQFKEAEEAYLRAAELYESLSEQPDARLESKQFHASARAALGGLYRRLGRLSEAQNQLATAQQIQSLVAEADDGVEGKQTFAAISVELASIHMELEEFQAASDSIGEATAVLSILVEQTGGTADSPTEVELEVDGAVSNRIRLKLARVCLKRSKLDRIVADSYSASADCTEAIVLLEDAIAKSASEPAYRHELARSLFERAECLARDADSRPSNEKDYRQAIDVLNELVADFPGVLTYQKELAGAQNGLATLLFTAGDLQAAEAIWTEAIDSMQPLIRLQPEIAENHSLLGRTRGNLGTVLLRQQQYDKCLTLFRDAVAAQSSALKIESKSRQIQRYLANHRIGVIEALLGLKSHKNASGEIERVASEITNLDASIRQELMYRLAAQASRAAGVLSEDRSVNEAKRIELHEEYVKRSVDILSTLIDLKWADAERMDSDSAFDPIRESDTFKAVRSRLP